MLVMKFGGTSLANAERVARAVRIVAAAGRPRGMVVSAIGDTTDRLVEAGAHAEAGDALGASAIVQKLRQEHLALCDELGIRDVAPAITALFAELGSVLEGMRLLREQTARSRALLLSFGERISAPLIAAALSLELRRIESPMKQAKAVDARELIITSADYDGGIVDCDATRARVTRVLGGMVEHDELPVITGFIAATSEGVTTTLGRGGSDYTATLLGALLKVEEIHIFTDVDGVLTADPRLVKEARTLERITYREAAEMSYFGARVLHPATIQPAAIAGIPVRVRSSFEPDRPGTVIASDAPTLPQGVKTVSAIRDQAMVTLEGRGMAGVPGVARRIFEASELAQVNVVMISQASSEQTVSLVVPMHQAEALCRSLEERFAPEITRGAVERVSHQAPIAVASIIGQGMAGTVGIAGNLFSALGNAGVNVLAIAQGASELSISVAMAADDAERAVRAAHSAFGLTRVCNILMLGCGGVGRTLLRLLDQTRVDMQQRLDLELRLVGVATSKKWLFDEHGLRPSDVEDALEDAPARPSDDELLTQLREQRFTDAVLVDVTAADTLDLQHAALKAGVHVVTANKLPLAGSLESYGTFARAGRQAGVRFRYETTFGAGLPVLHTLEELVHTGDEIKRVTGCLSGTLGFITSRLDDGASLVEAVSEAKKRGFTEPDPREDLSGRDVARKALIIARSWGLALEPDAVELEPLVPGLEDGLESACTAFQPKLDELLAQAKERGEVLRYVADIRPDRTAVGLRSVSAGGPIGSLRGPDNILVFQSARYDELPLVIRGPGAGAEVTAAGVLGDVLKIARHF
jgi:aspartokinase/homoserine dehydrogenase 1